MESLRSTGLWLRAIPLLVAVTGCATSMEDSLPEVDRSRTTARLERMPRKKASKRVPVTVYEFRSSVPDVNGAAATDMFTTALVKSGQFAVAQRQRLDETILREKALNADGKTTGTTAEHKLAGVRYIFEGTVSEFNTEQASNDGSLTVGGMTVGRGNKRAEIGLDVRVVDVDSGLVVDSVNLRKPLAGGTTSITGAGALASSVSEIVTGKRIPLEPDIAAQTSRRDGVDRALRACIEAALAELIDRLDDEE